MGLWRTFQLSANTIQVTVFSLFSDLLVYTFLFFFSPVLFYLVLLRFFPIIIYLIFLLSTPLPPVKQTRRYKGLFIVWVTAHFLLVPAVLPHCHSASNERSSSHGWYSWCYCPFTCYSYVCCFVICPESKNRAPRVLICNGLSLQWPWQIVDSQSSWTALRLLEGPHGSHQLNEEELNARIWHMHRCFPC